MSTNNEMLADGLLPLLAGLIAGESSQLPPAEIPIQHPPTVRSPLPAVPPPA